MAQTKAQLLNPLNGNLDVSGIVTSSGFKVGTGISLVGSGIAATSFYGDGSNLTGLSLSKDLTIGVRTGTAVTFSLTGSSFNVINRAGGDVSISI